MYKKQGEQHTFIIKNKDILQIINLFEGKFIYLYSEVVCVKSVLTPGSIRL